MMDEYYYRPIFIDGFWRVLIVQKVFWDDNKTLPKEGDFSIKDEMFKRGFIESQESVFTLRIKTSETSLVRVCDKFGMILNQEITL